MPLNTREGVAEAPIEPGARTLCEPCETGPRLKPWRLMRALEALALRDAGDLDLLAGLEGLDGDGVADLQLAGLVAELDDVLHRARRRPS